MKAVNLTHRVRDFGTVLEEIDRRQVLLANAGRTLEQQVNELMRELQAMIADRDRRIAAWEAQTLWQRLRWLIRGRA